MAVERVRDGKSAASVTASYGFGRTTLHAVWTGCLAVGFGSAAEAQVVSNIVLPDVPGYNIAPEMTVLDRPRPEYESPGVRVGDFVVRPNLTEGAGYTGNVIGTTGFSTSPSAVIDTQAGVQVASDWSRDSVGLTATVNDLRYPDQPRQSETTYGFAAGGTYQIGRDQLTLAASHLRAYITTSGIDNFITTVVPVPYDIDDVRLNYLTSFGRFSFRPFLDVSLYRFSGGATAQTPVSPQTDNTNVLQAGLATQYELAPRRNLVLNLQGGRLLYVNSLAGSPGRDSTNGLAMVGIDYASSGVLRYFVLLGYQVRSYDSPAYKPHTAPVFNAGVIWTPTRLDTVTATARRSIEDSTDPTLVGYTLTAFGVALDHELRRNILLQASFGYQRADYDQSNTEQALYNITLGATWLLNRELALHLTGFFTGRQSNSGGDFQGDGMLLQASFRL
jgi:hypothetical protein